MNIVCVGAHPDDCEFHAGGTAVLWARSGARVLFISMTNGDAGHHVQGGGPLARRRNQEAIASAKFAGVSTRVLEYHDGELTPTIDARRDVVRIIRDWRADLVLTHRPCDYHPDHRYTAMLVQDSAYMVTVPNFCPDVPPLEHNPVFMYMVDRFTKPYPFQPDVAVDVTSAMDTKWDMLDAMESQVYEWLPWTKGALKEVPKGVDERREWLQEAYATVFETYTKIAKPGLKKWYGESQTKKVRFAEAFEICEYGSRPAKSDLKRLFPFLPGKKDA